MRWYTLPLVALAVAFSVPASAQQAPGGGLGGLLQQLQTNMQNNGVTPQDLIQNYQQNNQQNPRQYYQNGGGMVRTNNLQAMMGSTDEEWTILAPKIQKVVDLSNELAQGTVGSANYNNIMVAPRQGQATASGAVAAALVELNTMLANASTPDSDIKIKLTALRDAKKKAQAELDAASSDLVELVTLRQEGVLISVSILN